MKYAYLNGEIISEDKAVVSIRTHAFNYGTAALEGIRAFYQKDEQYWNIFRPTDHFKRLKRSSEILHLEIPVTENKFIEILSELLKYNDIQNTIYFRPILYANNKGVGVSKKTGAGLAVYIEESPVTPVKKLGCHIVDTIRTPSSSIPARGKICGGYVNSYLAQIEASRNGYDCAIMMNNDGTLSEAYGMNVFIIKNDTIHTPSLEDNILPGITRDSLIYLINKYTDITAIENLITREFIMTADEAFVCGTGSGINSIISVDDNHIGSGDIGKVTKMINTLYMDSVNGRIFESLNWCVRVCSRD